jgi:hypothetical protein
MVVKTAAKKPARSQEKTNPKSSYTKHGVCNLRCPKCFPPGWECTRVAEHTGDHSCLMGHTWAYDYRGYPY